MNALLMDATSGPSMEEYAKSMGQSSNCAAVKGVQIKLRGEECAKGMVQRSNCVAVQAAQIKLSKEECASGMAQR